MVWHGAAPRPRFAIGPLTEMPRLAAANSGTATAATLSRGNQEWTTPPKPPSCLKGLFPKLLEGFTVTLWVGLAAMALALVLSVLLLGPRMSRNRLIRLPIEAYIELMRNTPLLLQIYLIYFGLPLLGFFPSEFACGVVGIALQHAASSSRYCAAALNPSASASGKPPAPSACGGSPLRYVILPQPSFGCWGRSAIS